MRGMTSPLVAITTYFNPCRYQTRRQNYERFVAGLRQQGVTLLTLECAFPGQEFELVPQLGVVQMRCDSLVWQKERLLNLAASYLPPSCQYVAWLDCDILFNNSNWASELCGLLQHYPIAQVFERCLRLDASGLAEAEPAAQSFASVMRSKPNALAAQRYDVHGHTGYGWAMHKSIFDEVGLYEGAISGSADHFMAHAIFNHYGFCIENALKHDPLQIMHLKLWGERFYQHTRGQLACVSGEIRHLWHGDLKHRRYFLRMHEITDLGYNPFVDILSLPGQALSWAEHDAKPALKNYFFDYFANRFEDGEQAQDTP